MTDDTTDTDGLSARATDDSVPPVAGIRDDIRSDLVTFLRALRRAGVDVPANAGVVATRALVEVGFGDERRARAALRAALVTEAVDVPTFDRMFGEFWRRLEARLAPDGADTGLSENADDRPDGRLAPQADADSTDEAASSGQAAGESESTRTETVWAPTGSGATEETDGEDPLATATYSPGGRPETVSVTVGPAGEELTGVVGRLTEALAGLDGRRFQPTPDGEQVAIRRALRHSVSTGGALVSVPERRRDRTAARVVVLADVSRSVLDTIDRGFLVRFLRLLRASARDCRIFLFDTDIEEVTEAFDAPTAQAAVDALERLETAWASGTRIGNAVTTIRDAFPDAVDRRTAVVIVSDGLEMGDVSDLETGMAWLVGRAGTVLWLNPLAATPEYEPTAAGMAAALPAVDGLFAFTGPDDVREIVRQLTRYRSGGPIGYEHDPRRPQKL